MKLLKFFKKQTKKTDVANNQSILNKKQLEKVIGGGDSSAIIGKGGKEVDKLKEEIK